MCQYSVSCRWNLSSSIRLIYIQKRIHRHSCSLSCRLNYIDEMGEHSDTEMEPSPTPLIRLLPSVAIRLFTRCGEVLICASPIATKASQDDSHLSIPRTVVDLVKMKSETLSLRGDIRPGIEFADNFIRLRKAAMLV